MGRRPGALVAIGAVLLIVGGAIVFVVLRKDRNGSTSSSNRPVVTSTTVGSPAARPTGIAVPKGKQAVAVTATYTAAGAGYVQVGTHVSLYALIPPDAAGVTGTHPYAKQLIADALVLDVSAQVLPTTGPAGVQPATVTTNVDGQAPEGLTLLLALTPSQAEQVAFATTFDQLYVSILAAGETPGSTPGVGYGRNYVAAP